MPKALKSLGYVVAVFLIASAGAAAMETAPPLPQPDARPLIEQTLRHFNDRSDWRGCELSRAIRTLTAIFAEDRVTAQLQTDSSDDYPSFLWYAVFIAVVLSAVAAYLTRRKG
jgi:hypothetical protein